MKCALINLTIRHLDACSVSLQTFNIHMNLSDTMNISIGNYTVREVLMKNRTRVWRNVYNTASA